MPTGFESFWKFGIRKERRYKKKKERKENVTIKEINDKPSNIVKPLGKIMVADEANICNFSPTRLLKMSFPESFSLC